MANFVSHSSCEKCGSSDAKAVYDDGSSHCFSCEHTVPSQEYIENNKGKPFTSIRSKPNDYHGGVVEIKSAKPVIDPAEWERLKENTTTRGYGYRSIRDDIYSKFGVRHAINEDKEVLVQYYPCTQEGQLVGLKVREHPKDFRSIGRTGAECELFMQFKFNRGGKYVVITEGECLLPETEVLTRSGWVSLNDYNQGEVMQGNGEFAHPVAKIFKPYSGKMVSYKSGSYQLDMTPEHNMIRVNKDGTLFKQKAGEKKNRHLNVPRSVNSNTTSDDLLTRIQVMLSADFTFRKEGDIYGVLKKERKIERAVYLLDLAGVRYSHTKDSRGYSSFFIHRGHGLNVSKEFSYERDLPFAATIIDEIVNWDGNTVPNRNQIEYSSVIEGNARFVQTCAHLCGYVSTVINRSRDKYSWYKVSVLFGKSESSVQNGFTEYDYNGYVACLTMPEGSLLVRQKGSISVTGNCDALAAYQMLSDYNRSKGWEYETACVSPTTGANSVKQIAANYKFFDSFDHVIVCYDNDKAGQEAIEQIVKVLPKGKVKIMRLAHKDANEYLEKNAERQFVSAFYEAEVYTPVGVLGSGQLYDRILGQAEVQKLPFPQFMEPLNDMFAGGLPLGHIINIAAGTGIGKCFGKGTKVLMYDFSKKNIEDVKVGDWVMGHDGTPREVIDTVSGVDKMYRVEQVKGMTYDVNHGHMLTLRQGAGKNKDSIVNIRVEDFIETANKKHTRTLKGYKGSMHKHGIMKMIDKDEMYIVGLWLAEGTRGKPQITLNNEDANNFLYKQIEAYANRNGFNITVDASGFRENCTMYNLTGGFVQVLRDYGIYLEKRVPEILMNLNLEGKLEVLAGIIDGDGYLSNNGYSMTMKNDALATDIVDLARACGLSVTTKLVKKSWQNGVGIYRYIGINGDVDKIPCRLARKKAIERKQIKNALNTGITVKEIGEGEYYGIEIKGTDKMFCLEDFTVVHNTSFVNELIYFWIYNSPHMFGIVSMELDAGQYGEALLSRHLSRKLSLISNQELKMQVLTSPDVKEKANGLFYRNPEEGEHRFYLLDNRDGSIEEIQDTIEELVVSCGCRIIVLDPLQDILDGLSNEEQAVFMKWCKGIIKSHGCSLILINHMRKTSDGEHREEDIHGSSTIIKSASANILLSRDKEAEDPVERNTTRVKVTKNRICGLTGPAGEVYYDNETHTLHNKAVYFGG